MYSQIVIVALSGYPPGVNKLYCIVLYTCIPDVALDLRENSLELPLTNKPKIHPHGSPIAHMRYDLSMRVSGEVILEDFAADVLVVDGIGELMHWEGLTVFVDQHCFRDLLNGQWPQSKSSPAQQRYCTIAALDFVPVSFVDMVVPLRALCSCPRFFHALRFCSCILSQRN